MAELRRRRQNWVIGGVVGVFADRMGIDSTLARVISVIISLFHYFIISISISISISLIPYPFGNFSQKIFLTSTKI